MAKRVQFRTASGEIVRFTAKKTKKSAKKRTKKASTRKAAPKRTRRAAPKRRTRTRTTTRRAAPKRTRRAAPKRTRKAAPRRSRAKTMCGPCASHAGGMNRKLEALKDYTLSNMENLKSRMGRAERTLGEHDRALAAVYSSGAKLLGSPQPRMPGIVRQSMPSRPMVRPVARAELRAPASRQLGSGM